MCIKAISKARKCPECKGDVRITIKNVGASVCQNCGQAFISPWVASDVNRLVNRVTEDINSFIKSQSDMLLKKTKRRVAIAV